MNAEQFQRQTNVSRETLEMYQTWLNLLNHWNKRINLVARSTLHDFWLRHALDSWQVAELLPQDAKAATKTVLDMGAGAGFPGIAMAIALKDTPKAQITLVESNGKKCNFLRTVIRELNLPAKAVQIRIENFEPKPYDIITARAFTSLPKLLERSHPFWDKRRRGSDSDRPGNIMRTTALFPKGENWKSEVDAARKTYDFDLTTTASQTNENAKILSVKSLRVMQEAVQ